MENRVYLCIDLKSFYASAECVDLGLDPMTTHLVVADESRTDKTICLAVTPALKAYGIPGRPRLFEVRQQVERINEKRRMAAPGFKLEHASADDLLLHEDPTLALTFHIARPRMAYYMELSTKIYSIYLKYIAPEDIYVYSIDEVFIDLTPYLAVAGLDARRIAKQMIQEILEATGITAAAGMGTNLYLAKVAMDIEAKHIEADEDGVRIAYLDEMSYRRSMWSHRPLTDFWRVGRGYAKKLEKYGIYTMGDIARCSLGGAADFYNEDLLYQLFGINAELLIDHAWGWEPCKLSDIKAYRPQSNSLGAGQVLSEPYPYDKAKLIVREMTDQLVLDLVKKGLLTDQITLTVGYDRENLEDPKRRRAYKGQISTDAYGRKIPKHAHGTANLQGQTSSTKEITAAMMALFERIVNPDLLIRRLNVVANRVVPEQSLGQTATEQLDLFSLSPEEKNTERERRMQQAVLQIKKRYGKNAILKGMNLQEGATAKDRNAQIGGHKA